MMMMMMMMMGSARCTLYATDGDATFPVVTDRL